MKYVALLSGGKDSCFNLLHCQKNGHELVVAASLGPEPGKEELDSFLYQTVGQDAIHLVAKALDVPLYRRVITGSAVEQGAEYGLRSKINREARGVQGDETEDLYELLASIKASHPDIQGVSVGAILSNYQRVRVEHVCSRLELTPLAYLWQRDQTELLSDMVQAGMEAVLIKVAGIGLTQKHLGLTLGQMQPLLLNLNQLYGSHVCGEGGEYESLTLDCPLFKKRIQLKDVETVIHSDHSFATVAYLRIKDAELVPKENQTDYLVEMPMLLEEKFRAVRGVLEAQAGEGLPPTRNTDTTPCEEPEIDPCTSKVGEWVSVCNVQRRRCEIDKDVSLEDEVVECFTILQEQLSRYDLSVASCTNINIFISSMEHFASINAVYGKYFGTSPPSRACVAVDLPHPIRVRLDCTAYIEPSPSARQALHVQGLSYWAPANIGPYSQAIVAGERVTISGQIGLIPSSLTLPSPPSFSTEFVLSVQHVSRVVRAIRNGWRGSPISATYFVDDPGNLDTVRRAHKLLHLPEFPTLFLAVKSLPKSALVETQVLFHTGRRQIKDDDGELIIESHSPTFNTSETQRDSAQVSRQIIMFEGGPLLCLVIFGRGQGSTLSDVFALSALVSDPGPQRIISGRLFYHPRAITFLSTIISECKFPLVLVPCRAISSIKEDDWDWAFHLTGD